jgi:FMN phosphatase YigB (HAD superfamily)
VRSRISLIVIDADNTLYDWVRGWAAATGPMIDRIARRTSTPRALVESAVRDVHRRWGVTECPSCVAELPWDHTSAGAEADEISREWDRHFSAARPLYARTGETIADVRGVGARVVVCTESLPEPTAHRLALAGLAGSYDRLYARQQKPDPAVLWRIAELERVPLDRILYIGDNLARDVLMARRAGVRSAWAHYGTVRRKEDEQLLARLCHWTPDATTADGAVTRDLAEPDIVLERDLAEILAHHQFGC